MRTPISIAFAVVLLAGCTPPVDIARERTALMNTDHEWSQASADPDKFTSFYAAEASFYPAGMPVVKGPPAIREVIGQLMAMPGFKLEIAPTNTQIGASGDVGYITGTYRLTLASGVENGKYVTVWRKQADGTWRVVEDIVNADAAPPAPTPPPPGPHTLLSADKIVWGDAPPSLPRGAKLAVVSGDPTMPGPFVVRVQMPAGYTIAPHWHPTDEHVTVLSGTLAFGMGDTIDKAAMQDLPAGGYALMPAEMHHYAMAKTAATIQVHANGPLAINYVNPADDPSHAHN